MSRETRGIDSCNNEIVWEYHGSKIGFISTILQLIFFNAFIFWMVSDVMKRDIHINDTKVLVALLIFAYVCMTSPYRLLRLLNQKTMYVKGDTLYLARYIGTTSSIPLKFVYITQEKTMAFGVLQKGGSSLIFFDTFGFNKHYLLFHYFSFINPRLFILPLGSNNLDKLYEILSPKDIETYLLNTEEENYLFCKRNVIISCEDVLYPKIDFDKIDRLREEKNNV